VSRIDATIKPADLIARLAFPVVSVEIISGQYGPRRAAVYAALQ
jgi:hypothetical protein